MHIRGLCLHEPVMSKISIIQSSIGGRLACNFKFCRGHKKKEEID